ncbi:type I-E CRISPR-associated protein Cse2/CasB [Streptomyces sp. NPDC002676]
MTDTTTALSSAAQSADGATPRQASPWLTEARQFVAAVAKVCGTDKGARAALRRGEGRPLDDPRVRGMHKIIAPLLPAAVLYAGDEAQQPFYAIAAMIAVQRRTDHADEESAGRRKGQEQKAPEPTEVSPYGKSIGVALAAAVSGGTRDGMREGAAEVRLNLLTRQSPGGLYRHLPSTVRQLCEKRCPPDWAQLLVDLRSWPRHRSRVGRRWLQDFYRARSAADVQAAREADDQAATEPPAATA